MTKRVDVLDVMRGMAVSMVISYHYWPNVFPWSDAGVAMFFVLSGYLIGGILLDQRESPVYFRTFYGRRAVRILPLYFLLLLVGWAAAEFDQPPWRYLLLVQNLGWTFDGHIALTFLGPTWSLAVEEQFYLLLPLLLWALPPRTIPPLLWTLVIATPLVRGLIHLAWPDLYWATIVLLPDNFDTLLGGVLLAWLERYGGRRWLWTLLALVAPSADAALYLAGYRFAGLGYSILALAFAAQLLIFVRHQPKVHFALAPLRIAGLGAYALYLFHEAVRAAVGSPFLALPIVAALAWFSWRWIEAPLIGWARERWPYQTDAQVATKTWTPVGVTATAVATITSK